MDMSLLSNPGGYLSGVANAVAPTNKAPAPQANPSQAIPGHDNRAVYDYASGMNWDDPANVTALGGYMQTNNISPDMLAASLNAGGNLQGAQQLTGQGIAGVLGWNYAPDAPGTQLFNPAAMPFSMGSSVGGSNSSGSSKSSTYSGLGQGAHDAILSTMLPELLKSGLGLEGKIDRYTQEGANLYERQAAQLLRAELPKILNQMAGRNMGMGSSVTGDAITNASLGIANQVGNQQYQAAMDAARMKLAIPAMQAQIVGLANENKGEATSQQSSSSTQQSQQVSAQPNVPYDSYYNFILNY